MTSVERSEWVQHDPPFTETTAVRIKQTGDNPDGTPTYSWWWNADNGALRHNIEADLRSRNGNTNTEIIRSVFQQAMLLVGMSALRNHERDIAPRQTDEGEANHDEDNASVLNAEDFVEHTTAAFSSGHMAAHHSLVQAPRRRSGERRRLTGTTESTTDAAARHSRSPWRDCPAHSARR